VSASRIRHRIPRWVGFLPLLAGGIAAGAVVPALAGDRTMAAEATDFTVNATPSNQFTPATVTIAVGDKVIWKNTGGTHNVSFNDGSYKQPPQPAPPQGWVTPVERTFTTAGSFAYICDLHGPSMSGRVVVQAPGTGSTSTGGSTGGSTAGTTTGGGTTTSGGGTTTTTGGGGTTTSEHPPPPTGGDDDNVRPRLTALSVTWQKGRLVIRFRSSERATLSGLLARRTGRRFTDAGSLRRLVVAGLNVLRLRRTATGRLITPGRYRLSLLAFDRSGNRSRPAIRFFRAR
jgi:plastocyanin